MPTHLINMQSTKMPTQNWCIKNSSKEYPKSREDKCSHAKTHTNRIPTSNLSLEGGGLKVGTLLVRFGTNSLAFALKAPSFYVRSSWSGGLASVCHIWNGGNLMNMPQTVANKCFFFFFLIDKCLFVQYTSLFEWNMIKFIISQPMAANLHKPMYIFFALSYRIWLNLF